MSILHSIIFRAVERGKTSYDPQHPINYEAKRAAQEKITPQGLPHGVCAREVLEAEVSGELLYAEGNPEDTTVLYIHGGGFVVGSTKTVRPFTGRLVSLLAGFWLWKKHMF